jgi:hypothetical protein
VYTSGKSTKHEQVLAHQLDYTVQGISPVYESLPQGGEPTDQTAVYTSGKSTKHEQVLAHQLDYTVQGISPVYESLPQGRHPLYGRCTPALTRKNPMHGSFRGDHPPKRKLLFGVNPRKKRKS